MDNAQKAIMIGVGLFITIIIISAVLLIVNLGTGLVDDATSELGTMSTSLQNQILQSYDNKILSGVQVRSAIQQYMTASDMTVVLLKTTSTTTTTGTTTSTTTVESIAATVGAKDIKRIKSSGEFYSLSADSYKGLTTDTEDNITTGNALPSAKKSSMNDFNDINNAGTGVYINTSKNYKSYVLKVTDTDTIVGIVFVPE